jgi:hypothetical protein
MAQETEAQPEKNKPGQNDLYPLPPKEANRPALNNGADIDSAKVDSPNRVDAEPAPYAGLFERIFRYGMGTAVRRNAPISRLHVPVRPDLTEAGPSGPRKWVR